MCKSLIRSFLFVCCFIQITASYSQHADDRFYDIDKVNIPFLEHLTKIKIDSVRKELGLKTLYNDSILYLAARDHSKYLIGKELSHFQPKNESKKDPQKRAEYYGAVNYLTGENIARTTLNAPVSHKIKNTKDKKIILNVNTYNLAAYSLVVSWVNSPPHYANLTKPDYDVTGMAISIDPHTKEVTAVQVFATVLYKFEFSNSGSFFPYAEYTLPDHNKDPQDISDIPVRKDYPWKLKPGNEMDHQKVKSIFFQGEYSDRMKKNGDDVQFLTFKVDGMKKLFRRKSDGFAIELVQYEPFHCGNPDYFQLQSRRNKKYMLNGYVMKPVYKKEIMADFYKEVKEIKLKKKQDIQEIKKSPKLSKEEKQEKIEEVKSLPDEPSIIKTIVGTFTKEEPGGFQELNLLVIQRRKIAYVIHYGDVCDENDLKDSKLPLFPKFENVDIDDIVNVKRVTFKVPFERNAYEITEAQIQAIRDSIPKNVKIKEINIEAWASVEGFEKINLDLQQKRAVSMQNIVSHLEKDSTMQVKISSGENWELFYNQIKNSPYSDWSKKSKEQIKKQLEDKQYLDAFNDFLNAQRRAELEIVYQESIDVNSDAAMAMGVFRNFIVEIESAPPKKIITKTVDAATTMQKKIFERFDKGEITVREINAISIPQSKKFIPLLINKLWFDYKYTYAEKEASQFPQEYFKLLKFCGADKKANIVAKYNYCTFVVNAWTNKLYPGSPSVDVLGSMIYDLSDTLQNVIDLDLPITHEHIDELMFNYHLKRAYYYEKDLSHMKAVQNSLNYINAYYQDKELNDSMTYVVASFFVKFLRLDLAKGILKPKAHVEKPDLKILSLYLKVSYQHVEEAEDESFYDELRDAYNKMTQDQWCDLFVGPCNISFQVFDHEKMRDFYCDKCAARGNYATKHR